MLVADVAGFEGVSLGIDGQHDLDDVAHRYVGGVRAVPTPPAQMEADAVLRQAAQRVIEGLDPDHREFLVRFDTRLGVHHVPIVGDRRIVELQDEAGIENSLVFFAQCLGPGVEELLIGLVVGVGYPIGAARGDGGHELLFDPGRGEGRLEIGDVGGDRLLSGIAERADAYRGEEAAARS